MTRMLDFEDFKRDYQKVPVEEYPNNVLEAVPEPMVSVQISTYQHADFIRDCLDGVLMQETNFPVEILIGEDESDDGTREICKEYADRHPDKIRLFLHRRENNIKIHGRPTGKFQSTYTRFKCRGKYIAMCEGDDYWTDPEKLQKQVEFLEYKEGFVLSYHPWVEKEEKFDSGEGSSQNGEKNVQNWPHTLTLLFERSKISICKKYVNILNGDAYVKYKLREKGKFGNASNIKPAIYRKHKNSMYGSKPVVQQAYESCISRIKILNCIKKEKVKDKIKEDLTLNVKRMMNSASSEKKIIQNSNKIYNLAKKMLGEKETLNVLSDVRVWEFVRIRLGLFKKDIKNVTKL